MAGERMTDADAFSLAVSLPPDAPYILRDHFFGDQASASEIGIVTAGTETDADTEGVVAIFDIDEYETLLRDPKRKEFMRAAIAERRQLRAEGRSS